jgi:hypothetical protein
VSQGTSLATAHADFGSMAHFETPSIAGGEFGTQMHL